MDPHFKCFLECQYGSPASLSHHSKARLIDYWLILYPHRSFLISFLLGLSRPTFCQVQNSASIMEFCFVYPILNYSSDEACSISWGRASHRLSSLKDSLITLKFLLIFSLKLLLLNFTSLLLRPVYTREGDQLGANGLTDPFVPAAVQCVHTDQPGLCKLVHWSCTQHSLKHVHFGSCPLAPASS